MKSIRKLFSSKEKNPSASSDEQDSKLGWRSENSTQGCPDSMGDNEFKYMPLLPKHEEIRLISFDCENNKSSDGDLTIHLKTVSLRNKPTFRALSYVWGDPTPTKGFTAMTRFCTLPRTYVVP
jgi:hypothetical protein